MKNWEPPVLRPACAIDNTPLSWNCFGALTSQGIVYPGPPVPFLLGHPPWITKPGITLWKFRPS